MSTTYEVVLTQDALRDLEELYDYIAGHDAPLKADQVLDKIDDQLTRLSKFPERGAFTRELLAVGIREYRETYFKPYRIIYRMMGQQVVVYLVVDGRRDMQALLSRRMLRS